MDKRWTLAIVTLIMVLLIYSFLSMVLKSDKKRNTRGRVYRDYTSYKKKSSYDDSDYYSENRIYASSTNARKIKRTLFSNLSNVTNASYNDYMKRVNGKKNDNSNKNDRLQEIFRASQTPLPELDLAVVLFQKNEYEDAISKLNEALEKLEPTETKRRYYIYSLLAECYLKLENEDGYVQNKIRQIRMQRKYENSIKELVPEYVLTQFTTTQEASTNLLKIKSSLAKLPNSPMTREMIKRAELDLEVARAVTQ